MMKIKSVIFVVFTALAVFLVLTLNVIADSGKPWCIAGNNGNLLVCFSSKQSCENQISGNPGKAWTCVYVPHSAPEAKSINKK